MHAGLPHPSQSWVETAPRELVDRLRAMARDGSLPPWPRWWPAEVLVHLLPDAGLRDRFIADCPILPMAIFEESHPVVPNWPDAPCAYLKVSQAYLAAAFQARDRGWPVRELSSHHLGLLTDPGLIAEALLDLVDQVPG